ncbi:MAG: hypothetical protein Alpg2KO_19670 [Alphaproteobacteria bacterium]
MSRIEDLTFPISISGVIRELDSVYNIDFHPKALQQKGRSSVTNITAGHM